MKNTAIELRKTAIKRHLAGEKPVAIYRLLRKSKRWFFKWLTRYRQVEQQGLETWYQEQPRIPKQQPAKTKLELEKMVVNIRDQLVKTKYAQIGADTITWELQKLGITGIPSIPTINRIIKRNGRVIPRKKRRPYAGKDYPAPMAKFPNDIHQFDIVGRRYIRGNQGLQSFYSFHLKDVFSHMVKIKQYQYKNAEALLDYFVNAIWKTLGIPNILQIDNLLAARGSNRHPRSFSNLIKLCLLLNIEVLFIPNGEPWRSGIIESFNNIFDKKFLRTQQFKNLNHLDKESNHFEHFCNTQRPNSALNVKEHGSKIPEKVFEKYKTKKLPQDFDLKQFCSSGKIKIPLTAGKISFIRWIKEDHMLYLFTEKFRLKHHLANEYVKATIFTKEQFLRVYFQDKIISEFKYKFNTSTAQGNRCPDISSN